MKEVDDDNEAVFRAPATRHSQLEPIFFFIVVPDKTIWLGVGFQILLGSFHSWSRELCRPLGLFVEMRNKITCDGNKPGKH
jgi:hypothetical protein